MLTSSILRLVRLSNPEQRQRLVTRPRLHAERLEDRFMMSADDPVGAGGGNDDVVQAAALSAASVAAEATDAVAGDASAANHGLPRFESSAEFDAWLLEAAVAQWGHLFGQSTYHNNWNLYPPIFLADVAVPRGFGMGMLDGNTTVAFSSTNVQVAGVDEADLIETDGEYLYIVSGLDLVIVKAGVGEELEVVSRVTLDERPTGMYLSGNRLALLSTSGFHGFPQSIRGGLVFATDVFAFTQGEITPPKTTVTVLDIADRAAPTLVQKTEMDGLLVTSRTVDGQLRIVLTNEINLPMPIARPIDGSAQPAEPQYDPSVIRGFLTADVAMPYYWGTPAVYETKEEYLARVRDEILDRVLPHVRSLALDGTIISESELFDATGVYRPESLFGRNLTTIATFDLSSNTSGPAATSTIITGGPAQVYASAESLYVFAEQASNHYHGGGGLWAGQEAPKTGVWKFDFDNLTQSPELVATGEFDGTLLNQFAADEHDGHLRLVTQSNWSLAGQSLHVLRQVGDELKVVGSIGGIAPNEQLYSVRFVSERAFFVTFRQTDPLFAVDLSDPEKPELLGELHIPGFSDYLEPIDENHLLAIGRGADEATGQFQELQVSIFDISNMTDPQLVHRYSFEGGRTTATPATGDRWNRGDGDHHAVSYFASDEIFAMPILSAEENSWWWDGDQTAALFEAGQGGLQVFRMNVDAGFTPLAIIEHDTLVERSLQIGDHLYAISSGTVTVHDLANPNARLGEVSIAAEPGIEPVALTMYEAPVEAVSLSSSEERGERPAPRADWLPSASGRSTYKPPARAAAFASLTPSPRFDDELVHALAVDSAAAPESLRVTTAERQTADDAFAGAAESQDARQPLRSRSAFRPVAAHAGF
jgi:Beta propeller domain